MSLTLTQINTPRHGMGGPTSRILTSGRLSIGRAAGNDWVLPDPERVISKRHCVIEGSGAAFHLIDQSVNGVFINASEQPVGREHRYTLRHGDRIRIGDYELEVSIEQPSAREARPAGGAVEGTNETADELRTEAPLTSAAHLFDRGQAGPRLPGDGSAVRWPPPPSIPDDESLFGLAPVAKAKPQSLADLDGGVPVDEAFVPPRPMAPHRQPEGRPSPAPEKRGGTRPAPGEALQLIPEDWDIGGGPLPKASPPAAPSSDTVAEQPAAPVPAITGDDGASRPPAAAEGRQPAGPVVIQGTLAKAFLEGAGLDAEAALARIGDPEQMMRETGAVFRTVVEGVIAVLEARRAVKREMGAAATEFRGGENNPLKFTLGVDDTLRILLTGGERGYLPAAEAFQEAFADIKRHQVAVLAGMQETWMDLLRRLDPTALDQRLSDDAGLGALLSSRKARCWDAFVQLYEAIAQDADTGYNSLFSRVFGHAYEKHENKGPEKPG